MAFILLLPVDLQLFIEPGDLLERVLMSETNLDVVGVGNAIVDVLAKCDEAFLARHSIPKGGMILIDEELAQAIYGEMAETIEVSGGSAANSIACISSLGGAGGFVGKVRDDALGDTFRKSLLELGVDFRTQSLKEGPGTGRCLVNVTEDAQRSMTTFLGAAGMVSVDDIEEDQIAAAQITFFEGYQFEVPAAREAFAKASMLAHKAGRKTALTLSDSGCVDRQFEGFRAFIPEHIDILLANELEGQALFETKDLGEMANCARALCPMTVITRSENGSLIVPRDGDVVEVAAIRPEKLEDTTGAGDAFAAGFLYGLSRDFELARAGAIGSLAASEVISHMGPRPEKLLKDLANEASLL